MNCRLATSIEGSSTMSQSDPHPLNDGDGGRNTQSIHDEATRQNEYMHWANQRWTRAQHDATEQCHRSYRRLVEAQQNNTPKA
jgi:hypothetical protein